MKHIYSYFLSDKAENTLQQFLNSYDSAENLRLQDTLFNWSWEKLQRISFSSKGIFEQQLALDAWARKSIKYNMTPRILLVDDEGFRINQLENLSKEVREKLEVDIVLSENEADLTKSFLEMLMPDDYILRIWKQYIYSKKVSNDPYCLEHSELFWNNYGHSILKWLSFHHKNKAFNYLRLIRITKESNCLHFLPEHISESSIKASGKTITFSLKNMPFSQFSLDVAAANPSIKVHAGLVVDEMMAPPSQALLALLREYVDVPLATKAQKSVVKLSEMLTKLQAWIFNPSVSAQAVAADGIDDSIPPTLWSAAGFKAEITPYRADNTKIRIEFTKFEDLHQHEGNYYLTMALEDLADASGNTPMLPIVIKNKADIFIGEDKVQGEVITAFNKPQILIKKLPANKFVTDADDSKDLLNVVAFKLDSEG